MPGVTVNELTILHCSPTLAAEGLRANLTQYLTTTFALADAGERAALARFVALLSTARVPDKPDEADSPLRPLVSVETHLWVRAVSRLLRGVGTAPTFGWDGEPPRDPDPEASDADAVVTDRRHARLPAVHCRHCGRSGWAAISPERDPAELVTDPDKI